MPVATVKHYLREKLLPPATKTHRNMAYYPPEAVERIRLVKELQEKRFLPLRVIKKLVAPRPGRAHMTFEELRGKLSEAAERAIAGAGDPGLERDSALRIAELAPAELVALERLGVVARPAPGTAYDPIDARLLSIFGRLRRAGFTKRRGFGVEILELYKRAIDALAAEEFAIFLGKVTSGVPAEEAGPMIDAAVEGIGEVMALLRRKALFAKIAELG